MKLKNLFLTLFAFALIFTSCSKDDEILNESLAETPKQTAEVAKLTVEKFIYRGMNDMYLYKADVPSLADSYFSSEAQKNQFLGSFESPEALFKKFKSFRDRFSYMMDDYHSQNKSFQNASSSTTGMKYGLGRITGTDNVFGFLQYVVPGTSAAQAGLSRGTVFTEVNGQQMTINNYSNLLAASNFTINKGKIEGGVIKMTDETAKLYKENHLENPVLIASSLDVDGRKIGYLMYNSFDADFDDALNAAFADFKSAGVTELVLDLRYNGGGSVKTAVSLASMITGQFEGKVFMKEQWNKKWQEYYERNEPEALINRFTSKIRTGEAINSLNLSKVYVLTTRRSASASELVINGLEPYIDVVQVGETTTGKFQASVTLYDSPNFRRESANSSHSYALQPLVLKAANAAGKTDYEEGLAPDVKFEEDLGNLGVLGDPSEPLLEAAINHITGKQQRMKSSTSRKSDENFSIIGENGMNERDYQSMFIEEIPGVKKE